MSRSGMPDPLKIHDKGGLPDPLALMKGSKEHDALKAAEAGPDQDAAAALPKRGAGDPEIAKRTEQFETRDTLMKQRASAAGATRSENEADLLGYGGPKKKATASRKRLLGE